MSEPKHTPGPWDYADLVALTPDGLESQYLHVVVERRVAKLRPGESASIVVLDVEAFQQRLTKLEGLIEAFEVLRQRLAAAEAALEKAGLR